MPSFFVLLTIALFAIAMTLYIFYLVKTRRPASYFDLRHAGQKGERLAKAIIITWNLSIASAVLYAIALIINIS
jgi:hypothetical protein